jgi:hypothetical protein
MSSKEKDIMIHPSTSLEAKRASKEGWECARKRYRCSNKKF